MMSVFREHDIVPVNETGQTVYRCEFCSLAYPDKDSFKIYRCEKLTE
jgi:hypothetical protein